jgi:hypothetical protein
MKVSIADFAAAFAKPKTDAREGKESLSKSIRNGLKRYNEKTREVVIWLWLFCVEGVKREESPGKSDRGNYLTCRRAAAKISALLSRKGLRRFQIQGEAQDPKITASRIYFP